MRCCDDCHAGQFASQICEAEEELLRRDVQLLERSDLLLRDGDVMSMAFSLETRFPLIDHKLVEFAATIPSKYKLRDGEKKVILKKSVADFLPEAVLHRPKLGFAFPFPIWLRRELRPVVEWVLSRERILDRGLFDYGQVRCGMERFFAGKELNYRKVWSLVILELWMRHQENDRSFFQDLQVVSERSKTAVPASGWGGDEWG